MSEVSNDSEIYECENCGTDVSTEDKRCPSCGVDISEVAEEELLSNAPRLVSKLTKRYKDAYLVAKALNGFGSTIKTIGLVVGVLITLMGLMNSGKTDVPVGIVAFVIGFVFGALFYIVGTLVSAQAQILKATLDSAVNSSPFLENRDKARIMSLHKKISEKKI